MHWNLQVPNVGVQFHKELSFVMFWQGIETIRN
jgi:hypothetical protein